MPAYIFLIVLLALVWLVLIRPRQRAMKAQQRQLQTLELGDEILTAGGIYGTVRSIDDDELRVEISSGLEVRVARRAVAAVLTDKRPQLEAGEGQEDTSVDTLSER